MIKDYKEKAKARIICIFFYLAFTILPFAVFSQVTFERVFGGSSTESAYRVEVCKDGGYITAGYTRSLGPGFANMHLIRTNKYGEQLWEFVEGGNLVDRAYAVSVTKSGDFVAVGSTTSFGAGQEDILVVKVDSTGKKAWSKTFGTGQAEEAWDIRETDDEGFILTGVSNSWGANLFDAFLLKLDKDGNEQWKKVYGGSQFDGAYCVRQTLDGGYAFLGQTQSHGQNGLFYFVKTDGSGNVEWEKTYGGAAEDEGRYFALASDGGYILIGKTASKGAGDEDYYVVKVDSVGEVQWDKTYGGDKKDTGKSIEPTNDGGYIMTGSSRSFNWLVPRVWIIKIGPTGSKIWEKDFGTWNHDHGHHIMPTDDGGFIATGHYNRQEEKAEDAYLLKLDSHGNWDPNAKDAAVTKLFQPYESDCARPDARIIVQVNNHGNAVLTSIPLTAIITGSINENISQVFSVSMAPGEEVKLVFSQAINTSGGGNFEIEVASDVPQDVYVNNNGIKQNISVSPNPAPVVNLGSDITKTGGNVELDAGPGYISYSWSTGASSQKITAENTGLYWVEVQDNNGCKASDSIMVMFTSVENSSGFSYPIKIYPNPSNGNFNIEFDAGSSHSLGIRVFNFSGQLLFERKVAGQAGSQIQNLNFTGYPAGIYFLNISDGMRVGTAKFIIN